MLEVLVWNNTFASVINMRLGDGQQKQNMEGDDRDLTPCCTCSGTASDITV